MFGWIGILVGIILIILGGWMIFILPMTTSHQADGMIKTGIVLGFIFLVAGGLLIIL